MKKLLIALAVLFAAFMIVGLCILVFVGWQLETGRIPDTCVIEGKKLKKATTDVIAEHVTFLPDEEIKFYYSAGLVSHTGDMNIVTNRRLISFAIIDGEEVLQQASCNIASAGSRSGL